jgi:signal transduction histidine kinase
MSSITRLLAFSALLLGLFLAVALAAHLWLQRQGERLQAEATEHRRQQFTEILALVQPGDAPWSPGTVAQLERLADAKLTFTADPMPQAVPGRLGFVHALPSANVTVTFALPPLLRLQLAHARTWVALLVLAAGLVMLVVAASAFWRRPADGVPGSRSPWRVSRGEMQSLERLAKTSVAQNSALTQERDARRRTEQDLALNQSLLNQSLEEKIRLGRDLHDGLIQSLYAVGLTLESAKPLLTTDPAETERRVEKCLAQLNATIRDVRDYITGLAPEKLQRVGFDQALRLLLEELRGERTIRLVQHVDEDAARALDPAATTEILQVIREAMSNSLRHGGATEITVRLHRNDREVGLLVQDNGRGFETAGQDRGFGLDNMQARAVQLGASLRIDSQPGAGTRVIVTLPLAAP